METNGKNGGARPGAGRKPKADEIKLIETMDAVMAPAEAWEQLAEKVKEGDVQAVKVWLGYRYGQPRQVVDANFSGELGIIWNEVKNYGADEKTDEST